MHPNNRAKAEYCNIPTWWDAGYTGKGVVIATLEGNTGHGAQTADILRQVAPDAEILHRPQPGLMIRGGELDWESQKKIKTFYQGLVADGVNIVVMSLLGTATPLMEQMQRDILHKAGITLIVAAGNVGKDIKPGTAAGMDTWIAVGAAEFVGGKPERIRYSNTGEKLAVMGFTNLYTTNGVEFSGTSCAAPEVAGKLALYFQWHKEIHGRYPTHEESGQILATNAHDMHDPGFDTLSGHGLFVLPKEIPAKELPSKEDGSMQKVVCIDAGHGGTDPGAVGNGLKEKDLTLTIAVRVGKLLEQNGLKVVYPRWADNQDVGLAKRAEVANYYKADLFVSIHVNAGGGSGFESYTHPNASVGAKQAQAAIHSHVAPAFTSRGLPDRGRKTSNFQVLRETKMPAVLLELGFIDNARDVALLKQEQFIEELATATANGILTHFGIKPEPAPAPKPPEVDYKALYESEKERADKLQSEARQMRQVLQGVALATAPYVSE